MKTFSAMLVLVSFVCCFLFAGCKSETADEIELFYDPTENPDKMTSSGYDQVYTVECSVIFKAYFLKRYIGWEIVAIKLFNPVDADSVSYTPKIYEAEAGASSPGPVLSPESDPVEIEGDTWKKITLDAPISIEPAKDYWAGYSVTTIPGKNLIAQGSKLNYGNSRIAFHGSTDFKRAQSNYLIRIIVKKPGA